MPPGKPHEDLFLEIYLVSFGTYLPVSSSSLTLFFGVYALGKAATSPVFMDWPHTEEDPYQSAQPEILVASQNYILVQHAYFILCSRLVSRLFYIPSQHQNK